MSSKVPTSCQSDDKNRLRLNKGHDLTASYLLVPDVDTPRPKTHCVPSCHKASFTWNFHHEHCNFLSCYWNSTSLLIAVWHIENVSFALRRTAAATISVSSTRILTYLSSLSPLTFYWILYKYRGLLGHFLLYFALSVTTHWPLRVKSLN